MAGVKVSTSVVKNGEAFRWQLEITGVPMLWSSEFPSEENAAANADLVMCALGWPLDEDEEVEC